MPRVSDLIGLGLESVLDIFLESYLGDSKVQLGLKNLWYKPTV